MGFNASTLSTVSLASQIGGGITSAFGAYSQASIQRSNLEAQGRIADANARISEIGAQQEAMDGQLRSAATTQRYGQLRGSQRAALAASGVALDQGSAADVMASTETTKEADRTQIEINAARAAFGQRVQASNQRSQASMARANASGISPGGAAFTSLLGSAGSVAQSWYQIKGGGGQASGGTLAGNSDPIYALYELNNGWR